MNSPITNEKYEDLERVIKTMPVSSKYPSNLKEKVDSLNSRRYVRELINAQFYKEFGPKIIFDAYISHLNNSQNEFDKNRAILLKAYFVHGMSYVKLSAILGISRTGMTETIRREIGKLARFSLEKFSEETPIAVVHKLEYYGLPIRLLNTLKYNRFYLDRFHTRAVIETPSDLIGLDKTTLLGMRNFGEKSWDLLVTEYFPKMGLTLDEPTSENPTIISILNRKTE